MAGGTGFIGGALCSALAEIGHEVTLLSRYDAPSKPPLRRVAWSGPWKQALDGAGAVINLAGASIADRRWSEARKKVLVDSRLEPTRKIVAALGECRAKPGVLLNASAVGFYGDRGQEALNEGSEPGSDFLAKLCVAWEREALQASSAGVRVVCLRFGVVLGAGGGALPKMALPFRFGLGGPLGPGRQYMPWVHRADVVGVIRHAMEKTAIQGPVNVVSPELVRNAEFSRALARALKRPCLFRVPAFALRLAVGEMADALLCSQKVEPEVARRTGYQFRFPGLQAALEDCLRNDGARD